MKLSTMSKRHLFAGALGLASLVSQFVPQLQAAQLNFAEHQQGPNPENGLRTTSITQEQAKAASLTLPLHFEANQGQTNDQVQFLSRGSGYTLFLTPGEAVFSLYKPAPKAKGLKQGTDGVDNSAKMSLTVMKMKLVGNNPEAQAVGLKELPGKSHYFKGSDAQRWNIDIPTYGQVKYQEVYPGVDLVYYGQQGQLEYDFVVSPQADPGLIQLAFEGAEKLNINSQGDLVLSTQGGDVHVRKPYVYQEVDGARQPIAGSYLLLEQEATDSGIHTPKVGFQVATYDSSKPLVIDPIVMYSTYLGGNGYDNGTDVAADAVGNIYIAGYTSSADFPTSGGYDTTFSAPLDGFITKLSTTGAGLLYSTYLGGSGTDAIDALAVDASGNVYVTGNTLSFNFPTTANAFQSSFAGGDIGGDAFVTKLSANGSALLYSTYLGGSSYDFGTGITRDASGYIYVVGYTYSSNFPKTAQAFDKTLGGGLDAFVAKLNPSAQKPFSKNNPPLVYSTYLGGNSAEQGNGIVVNTLGQAYVTGTTGSTNFPVKAPTIICVQFPCPLPFPFQSQNKGSIDAFVTKLNSTGSGLIYSTYLGGSQDDEGFGIALNTQGQAHITGYTGSADFPLVNAAQWDFQGSPTGLTGDAFMSKFNSNGTGLLYSTYLGGTGDETAMDIAVDNLGNAYVVGTTDSPDFPMVNALQPVFNGGSSGLSFPESGDAFVTKVNTLAAGPVSQVFSTYFGGSEGDSGNGISLDIENNVYIAGSTSSIDLLTTPDAYDEVGAAATNAFAAKISGL